MATTTLDLTVCSVDLGRAVLVREGREVSLSAIQAGLLSALADARGEPVSRADLLERVWGHRPGIRTRAVDMAVRRLRCKIEAVPEQLAGWQQLAGGREREMRHGQSGQQRGRYEAKPGVSWCCRFRQDQAQEGSSAFGRRCPAISRPRSRAAP